MTSSARGRTLAVVETAPPRRGPNRSADRRVTFAGLVIAGLFLAAAAASIALPVASRLGWWLPVHLAFAGAAATAIAAMVPFFTAALTVAPSPPAWLHAGAIGLVAAGAVLATVGRATDSGVPGWPAATGAGLFVAGMAAVAASTFMPLRWRSGPRRPSTVLAYGFGLLAVLAGVSVAGLYLAGVPLVLSAWGGLRVAHAWLNVFGFLATVVAGTLVHFAPTVAGARIRARRSGGVAIGLLAAGVMVGVGGYGLGSDLLVRLGLVGLVSGAAALAWHGLTVVHSGAHWTGDLGWHRFTAWSLAAAPAWLLATALLVAWRAFPAGADGAGWRLGDLVAPLVSGFAVQVLLGALVHLVPVIGPGDHERHAVARSVLGRGGSVRWLAWNLATLALAIGLAVEAQALALVGGGVLALALGANLVLLVRGIDGRR